MLSINFWYNAMSRKRMPNHNVFFSVFRSRSGRPSVTNVPQVRYISKDYEIQTVSSFKSHYHVTYDQLISNASIRRRIDASRFRSRRLLGALTQLQKIKVGMGLCSSTLAFATIGKIFLFQIKRMMIVDMEPGVKEN